MTANSPNFLVLGLESSCDETAAAIVRADKTVLVEKLATQTEIHRPYGGVVPEIAARAHLEQMDGLVRACLEESKLKLEDIDAIAATTGPGLIGGVMVGMMTGKALAAALGKPFIAVNHLAGHALSPRLVADIAFPYLLLLVSGGHCQILLVEAADKFRRIATTIDDAAGEAFDKVAKLLDLGYPGGPAIDRLAKQGNAKRFALPVPMFGRAEPHFSFSGLKTAVRQQVQKLGTLTEADKADMAASFQASVVAAVADRTKCALGILKQEGITPTALVVAGGVAANSALRAKLVDLAALQNIPFIAPPLSLCTDNATMIAWAGHEKLRLGQTDDLSVKARPRWPLDPDAEAARGAGVKA